ncbi:diguanylate cyclase domain-containing protein [Magnetospirillum molischianum]|uniref:Putative two-component response transcriptional regulator, GGDEF domain n=1 Tax=Magnetospirillum molischianum DSM 120 TaxID=1150626 RepID=H8FQL1_MAGML|nr:diguanylate cyclase [Magnetospirillum molischianum]CCG40649.1 Putative two-component response transcriptional regulator, GGDEF domain [Magnetospirillum molischianum DSM 120]
MNRLATLLVTNADRVALAPVLTRLEAAGYALADGGDRPVEQARRVRPDLILVGEADGDPVTLGAAFRANPDCADIPVVVLTHAAETGLALRALAAELDEVLDPDADDPELFARLKPLIRLATMHAELRLRAAAAATQGLTAASRFVAPAEPERPTVLAIGADPASTVALLSEDAEITTIADLYEAERLLEQRNFDAAILTASGEAELAFASQVRHNPRLFNLPILMIADDATVASRAYRRGASRVLDRPLDPGHLRAAVLTLVRRQKVRWGIRAILGQSLGEATADPLTGAYSRAFLESYLGARLDIARTQARPLAVVFFAIPNIEGVRRHFGDEAASHLTRQLGQWITGLVRAEDTTALFAANRFCVVLPDTPLVEAEVVMHRIAGVLSNTDFAIPDVYQPVRIWVQVGCTDTRPDDDCASLFARAGAALDEELQVP